MAGRIILLDDFAPIGDEDQSVTALFIYEILTEKKIINGVVATIGGSTELITRHPEVLKYGLLTLDDLAELDDGVTGWDTMSITRRESEPGDAIRVKLQGLYQQRRTAYIKMYKRRFFVTGKEFPPNG